MRHLLAFSIYLLAFLTLSAQELTVRAPGRVDVGSRFEVRYEVNDRASDFRGPSFKGLSVLSGPMVSHQQGMTIINGQMSRNVSTGFTYIILADAEGTFNIGSASCNVDGKRVTCQGFSIRVEKGSTQAPQQNAYGGGQQRRQSAAQPAQSGSIDSKSLFARASISKNNPYQGEQVILTYKIYTQVSLSQYQIDKLPGNKGFWSEDITRDGAVRQYEETVDGRRYMVAEIRRGALFAQESGKLTIEPLDLDVLALVQRQRQRTGSIWDLFDDPFFNMAQAVDYPLHTKTVPINVKPLPASPDNFSGGVGSFSVDGGLNLNKVKSNEAVSYRITVKGRGNLMLITPPTPEFPSSFEVYDPQIDDNITRGDNGVSGSRTFEWVLIPRSQGKFTIPAYKFIYFDPTTSQYVTLTIPAQTIDVAKGKASASTSKDDVQLLNRDINYIHPLRNLKPLKEEQHAEVAFYLALVLIVLLTGIAILWGKKRQADAIDVVGMRKKQAIRMARRRLKKATSLLGSDNSEGFYEEIYKAIWGCLSDKYSIPLSQLNRDSVAACLGEKQVGAEQMENIMKVLQDIDMARFAPGDAHAQMQTIYDESLDMIVNLI